MTEKITRDKIAAKARVAKKKRRLTKKRKERNQWRHDK